MSLPHEFYFFKKLTIVVRVASARVESVESGSTLNRLHGRTLRVLAAKSH